MRTYISIVKNETILASKICDICGAKSDNDYDWVDGGETQITYYPSHGKSVHRDICSDCFENILIPFIDNHTAYGEKND